MILHWFEVGGVRILGDHSENQVHMSCCAIKLYNLTFSTTGKLKGFWHVYGDVSRQWRHCE